MYLITLKISDVCFKLKKLKTCLSDLTTFSKCLLIKILINWTFELENRFLLNLSSSYLRTNEHLCHVAKKPFFIVHFDNETIQIMSQAI